MPPGSKKTNLHTENPSAPGDGRTSVYEILRYVPVGIYHIDLVNLRLLMVNDYMCKFSGYTEEELLACNPMDVLTPQSRTVFYQRLQAMAAGEPVSSNLELEAIKKSGETEWAQIHIHHIREKGRITSAYVVAHSISEQKRIQDTLVSHRQELKQLVDDRTSELAQTNRQLREEIEQRKAATEKLRANSERLEELNTAMRVLLDKRNEDHLHAEELIRLNLKVAISAAGRGSWLK